MSRSHSLTELFLIAGGAYLAWKILPNITGGLTAAVSGLLPSPATNVNSGWGYQPSTYGYTAEELANQNLLANIPPPPQPYIAQPAYVPAAAATANSSFLSRIPGIPTSNAYGISGFSEDANSYFERMIEAYGRN